MACRHVQLVQLQSDDAERRRNVAGLHVRFSEHGQCVPGGCLGGVARDTPEMVNDPLTTSRRPLRLAPGLTPRTCPPGTV